MYCLVSTINIAIVRGCIAYDRIVFKWYVNYLNNRRNIKSSNKLYKYHSAMHIPYIILGINEQ